MENQGEQYFYVIENKEDLKDTLKKQIEYYFSYGNLKKDFFLLKKMNKEMKVPFSLIKGFAKIVSLTTDVELIKEAILESPIVEMVHKEDDLYVGPRDVPCMIVLTKVDESVQEEDVKSLFSSLPEEIKKVEKDCWNVSFSSQKIAKEMNEQLKDKTLKGNRIVSNVEFKDVISHYLPTYQPFIPTNFPKSSYSRNNNSQRYYRKNNRNRFNNNNNNNNNSNNNSNSNSNSNSNYKRRYNNNSNYRKQRNSNYKPYRRSQNGGKKDESARKITNQQKNKKNFNSPSTTSTVKNAVATPNREKRPMAPPPAINSNTLFPLLPKSATTLAKKRHEDLKKNSVEQILSHHQIIDAFRNHSSQKKEDNKNEEGEDGSNIHTENFNKFRGIVFKNEDQNVSLSTYDMDSDIYFVSRVEEEDVVLPGKRERSESFRRRRESEKRRRQIHQLRTTIKETTQRIEEEKKRAEKKEGKEEEKEGEGEKGEKENPILEGIEELNAVRDKHSLSFGKESKIDFREIRRKIQKNAMSYASIVKKNF